MFIKGIDVVLYTTNTTGTDEFDTEIVEETPITIKNVIVGQPTSQEISDSLSLYGKKVVYVLCIPKGDTNDWNNKTVEFFGQKFHTFGGVTQYMEHMIPLSWNKQIKVEVFEEWQESTE